MVTVTIAGLEATTKGDKVAIDRDDPAYAADLFGTPDTGFRYDAFVSYGHQDDKDLAPALQAAMQRFAKPWYKTRALRVFRDQTDLTADPGLWASIEQALARPRWFILLASASAAESKWVNREIEWWLRDPARRDRLRIVATGSALEWDEAEGDWADDAPVPPALRGVFAAMPRSADLTLVDRSDTPIKLPEDAVADVVAPIRDIEKSELIGVHLREHRRTMRLVSGATVALTVLTAAAIAASVIAVGQRDTARNQARIATAREVAALSAADLSTHLDLAQLLAVAAYRMDDDPQTEAALSQAVSASPHLVRYLQAGAPVTALATSANGNVVVAGTATGGLVWFNLATRDHRSAKAEPAAISSVAVSADGGTVAATDGRDAVTWEARTASRPQPVAVGSDVTSVAVSPSGQLAAFDSASSPQLASITVKDLVSGRQSHADMPTVTDRASFDRVMFTSPSSLVLLSSADFGYWEKLSLPGLREVAHGGQLEITATGGSTTGTSPDDTYSADARQGYVTAWVTTDTTRKFSASNIAPFNVATAVAVSPDGKWAAVVEGGIIYVGPLSSYSPNRDNRGAAAELAANGDTANVSFSGADNRLVSSSGDAIALWDLSQESRVGQNIRVSVPNSALTGNPPALAFSPDGRKFVVMGGLGGISTFRVGRRYTQASSWDSALNANFGNNYGDVLVWKGGQPLFLDPSTGRYANADGEDLGKLPEAAIRSFSIVAAQYSEDGKQLVAVGSSGAVRIVDIHSGRVRRIPAPYRLASPLGVAIDPNGASIAECAIGQGKVLFADIRTGKFHVVGTGNGNGRLAFTKDRLLIQRNSGALQIWDATGRHLISTLPGGAGSTDALAVSGDGSLVALLSDDGTASVSSVGTGQVIATFSLPTLVSVGGPPDPWIATAMQFTPDDRGLLTATSGQDVIRWNIYGPSLAKIACSTVGRQLTAAEWRRYVHTRPPANLPCGRRGAD